MLQFLKGSIAFHRLHSKTIPTDIPIFISLDFCLDFRVTVPHDILTLQGYKYTQLSLPKIIINMSVLAHHRLPATRFPNLHPQSYVLKCTAAHFLLLNLNVVRHYWAASLILVSNSNASSPNIDTENGRQLEHVNDVDKY